MNDVCFWGQSGDIADIALCPLMTQSGLSACAQHLCCAAVGSWRVRCALQYLLDGAIPKFQLTTETLSFALSLGP